MQKQYIFPRIMERAKLRASHVPWLTKSKLYRIPQGNLGKTQKVALSPESAKLQPTLAQTPKLGEKAYLGGQLPKGSLLSEKLQRMSKATSAKQLTQRLNSAAQSGDVKATSEIFRKIKQSQIPPLTFHEHTKASSKQQFQLYQPSIREINEARNGDLDPSMCIKINNQSVDYRRQYSWETESLKRTVEKYHRMQRNVEVIGRGACLAPGEALLLSWFEPLKNRIARLQSAVGAFRAGSNEVKEVRSQRGSKKKIVRTVEPFPDIEPPPGAAKWRDNFLSLDAEKMAVITIHTMLGSLLRQPSQPYRNIIKTIGETIKAEVKLNIMKKDYKPLWRSLKKYNNFSTHQINQKRFQLQEEGAWPLAAQITVGGALLPQLLEIAKVEDLQGNPQPAFIHFLQRENGKLIGQLKANPLIYKLIGESHAVREDFHARMFPMIVEPKKWTSFESGGYLTQAGRNSQIMRLTKDKSTNQIQLAKNSDMQEIFMALNILGSTQWKVNKEVYRVVKQVWDSGGGLADIPSRVDRPLPEEPISKDPEELKRYKRLFSKVAQHNRDLHSLRCDHMLKMEVAREFLNEDKFFFPHNIDFRGRCYPIPPHLNHMGADICRGLLIFAEGRQLTERGFWWLKVHTANLFGKDKLSFDDRVKFVEEHLENIIDCAENPFYGSRWWLKAEEPWQFLSCCFEIHNAIKSGNPAQFISHLPIHQDGTCNGLQHYAALGKDTLGARSVNLVPSDKPQDVYSGIARLVQERIARDAALGNPLAQKLNGKIERQVIKQTVMTSVYGVTWIGARAQVESALKDRKTLADEDDLWKASGYITGYVFDSLGEMFNSAKEIMAWLGQCARLISKSGHEVTWKSPLNLIVCQPYKTKGSNYQIIKTLVQDVCLIPENNRPVNTRKQKTAFPPNYVHSLDSTHMMKTAISCNRKGLTFASIHDSYWTHASTVDDMNVILREEFINLYKSEPLKKLAEYLKETYPDVAFPPLPETGDFNLEEVRNSTYFFN